MPAVLRRGKCNPNGINLPVVVISASVISYLDLVFLWML